MSGGVASSAAAALSVHANDRAVSKTLSKIQLSLAEVNELIDSSFQFAYKIYRVKDVAVKHTGILVYLDGKLAFSVDWGVEPNGESCVTFSKQDEETTVLCTVSEGFIQDVPLDTKDRKEKVKDLVHKWQSFGSVQDYNVETNNCRNFCQIAIYEGRDLKVPFSEAGKSAAFAMIKETVGRDQKYFVSGRSAPSGGSCTIG